MSGANGMRAAFFLALLMMAFGCDDGGGDPATDAGPGAGGAGGERGDGGGAGGMGGAPTACVRDEAALAERAVCFLDQACPCGAHCVLGRCESTCATTADCDGEGEVCDPYGRCRGAAVAHLPAILEQGSPPITVDRSALDFSGEGAISVLRLQPTGEPLRGPVRVVVGDGVELADADGPAHDALPGADLFEIECAPGDWAADCMFADAAPATLRVRAKGPALDRTVISALTVLAGARRLPVGLRRLPADAFRAPPLVRPGVYRGHVWPLAAGLESASALPPLADAIRALRLPVSLRVHATGEQSAFVVQMSDPVGGLLQRGAGVGRIGIDNAGDFVMSFPATPFLTATAGGAGEAQIVSAIDSGALDWQNALLAGQFDQTFWGVTAEDRAPVVRWQLAVTRVADLDAGEAAPAVPPPVERPDVGARAFDPPVAGRTVDFDPQASAAVIAQQILCGERRSLALDGAAEGLDVHGDLPCEGAAPMLAFPAFGAPSDAAAVGPLLRACDAELQSDAGAGDLACVDAGRLKLALDRALTLDRDRAFDRDDALDPVATTLAHRLLQQWLGLHGWLLTEARNAGLLADAVAGGGARVDAGPGLPPAFAAADRAWMGVLHPRVATALAAATRDALRAPDYRVRLGWDGASARTHEQPLGLPVTLLGAMGANVGVMRAWLLDGALFRAGGGQPADASRLLRQAWVVMALSNGLHRNATQGNAVDWQGEWETARATFGVALAGLIDDVERLGAGRNPLGIDDDDLPLPRVGGQDDDFDRYFAASDVLVGDGGLARGRVDAARSALTAVRDTWLALQQRRWDEAADAGFYQDRLREVHTHYGEMIWGLCAQPNWNSVRVGEAPGQEGILDLILDAPACAPGDDPADVCPDGFGCFDGQCKVDTDRCFLDATQGECRFDAAVAEAQLSVADLGYEACLFGKLRAQLGPEVTTGDSEIDERFAELFRVPAPDEPFLSRVVDGFEGVKSFRLGTQNLPVEATDRIALARLYCDGRKQATLALRPVDRPGRCATTDDCPAFDVCEGGACRSLGAEGRPPSCYVGSLGVAALGILAATQDVEIARSQLAEHTERYDIVMRSCLIQKLAGETLEDALAAHQEVVDNLAQIKLGADIVANAAGAAKDSADVNSFFTAGAKAGAALVEAAAKSVSAGADYNIGEAERAHEANVLRLENDTQNAVCANDAESELVGARTATLAVQRTALDLAGAVAELTYQKYSIGAAIAEGTWTLSKVRDDRLAPQSTNFWLDEDIAIYDRRMRAARRAVYLGLRAVEYEFQQTLGDQRMAVLGAANPGALEAILDGLANRTRSGQVAGASPRTLATVVSLRDHLLRLRDDGADDGPRALDASAKLGALLADPRFAVTDAQGRYLGQAIPFAIFPRGRDTTDEGEARQGGVEVLAGRDCAERVWAVSAVVQGRDLLVNSESTRVNLTLRKRNTFASQWCRAPEGAGRFQTASIRPAHNLFVDPLGGPAEDQGVGDAYLSDATDAFSDARLQSRLNVSLADLEALREDPDASTELAGRGLYGDYILQFDREDLTDDAREQRGLDLGQVDDILIRLEYVSVAKPR